MAEQKKKRSASLLQSFLVNVFLGANIATLVLLWACCGTTWIDPSLHPRVSVIGLLFPVILLLNLLFVPFWLVYKPRMLVVPLLGMAVCSSYILDYFPIHMGDKSSEEADLVVFTWNSHYLTNCPLDSVDFLTDYLLEHEVDVACLQEALSSAKYDSVFEPLRRHGYHIERNSASSMIIASRYPILKCETLPMESKSTNTATYADILVDEDTVSVFNVHLESNSLSAEEKAEYGEALTDPERDKVKSEALFLTGKISAAAHYRGLQIDHLAHRIDSLPEGRRILFCGDFNDTPISYVYQHIGRRLQNAYRRGGNGVGVSFNETFFPVRIDNIFYSAHWECLDAKVESSITVSDHYPILARLKCKEK